MFSFPTGIEDRNGDEIYTAKHVLVGVRNDRYDVIDDPQLGFSLRNIKTGTIEQLTQNIAYQLVIEPVPYE